MVCDSPDSAEADHQERPAAVQVGELAVERDGDRAREQVDRHGPDVQGLAAELADDPRQRHADDRLVEGAQEEPEHDRAEDLELGAPAEAERRVFGD